MASDIVEKWQFLFISTVVYSYEQTSHRKKKKHEQAIDPVVT